MKTRQMTRIAILAALSAILFFIEIPVFAFYRLDFSNLPALIGGFAMGPVAGALICLIKSLTGLLHSSTGGVGELADLLMGIALVVPAAMLYSRKKTRTSAVIGMIAGSFSLAAVGILANYYILIPFYGVTDEVLMNMAPSFIHVTGRWSFVLTVTLAFNIIKGAAISLVTLMIYKPLSPILH